MKQKTLNETIKTIVFCLFLFTISISSSGQIVNYALTDFTGNSTGGLAVNHPGGVLSTTGTDFGFYPEAYCSSWDAASGAYKYWEISPFSTEGYHTIQVSAFVWSDITGPRDFKLEYKVGSEGTWITAGTYTVDATSTTKTLSLPLECTNKPSVYVRWVATSYINTVGGAVASDAYSYISTIAVIGNLPTTPTLQANTISIVAETPTTITIDCSPGNGDNRIVLVNTVNDFTDPVDDQIFSANADYTGGSSQQVVYAGIGTNVTITVDHATDQFYFRVYDYFFNGGMTRYITDQVVTTTLGDNNPKLCALEAITAIEATDIGLVRATVGGDIAEPLRSNISARGIVWSTSPNVPVASNKKNKSGMVATVGGEFLQTYPATGPGVNNLPRNSTIYYKAFVTNQSGTIYSNELSFSNGPIFTGTGNWEDNTKWNVSEVPGANGDATYGSVDDSPIIRGNCTINTSNDVTDLTIESGRKLTISPETKLGIAGTLTNSAGTSGLLIKSSSTQANGSLVFSNPGNNSDVSASVEMYSKSYWDTQYHWQYFGIPVQSTTVGATFTKTGNRVRKYDESNIDPTLNDIGLWKPAGSGATMAASDALVPVDGYEVVKPSVGTYTFKGSLFVDDISRTLDYTSGADWAGNNIYANPYAAAMDITKISYGAGTEAAVYLYNTGSREEWDTNVLSASAGTYDVSTTATAGELGVPAQIPSMQGFLVKTASTNNTNASFGYSYSNLTNNSEMQRVRTNALKVGSRIDVIGSNSADKMWLFTDANCSSDFDNGWDGRKMVIPGVTQLYAVESDGEYQIDAVNDINNVALGFRPNSDGAFKLVFTHQYTDNLYSRVYLVDLKENISVDITNSGAEYDFESESTDDLVRFKVVTSTTGTENTGLNPDVKVFGANSSLFVDNKTSKLGNVALYNLSGAEIYSKVVNPNGITTINNLQPGVYVAKAIIGTDKYIERVIMR